MSRFFRGDGSSSESEEESSSGDENVEQQQQVRKAPTRTYNSSSDDDDAPVKRVVQSQQAKLAQEYDALITKIKQHIKTNEFTAFQGDLDKLDKALQKSVQKGEAVPQAYIKAICMLEDHVNKTVESHIKLNAVNQKALNAFKQKFKKHNLPYQKQITEYRENPDKAAAGSGSGSGSEAADESEEGSEASSDDEPKAKKAAPKKAAAKPVAAPAASGDSKPKYGKSFFAKKPGAGSGSESSSEDDSDFNPDESESDEESDEDKNTRWKLKKGGDEPIDAGKKKKPPKDKGQVTKPKADKQEKEKVVVKEMTGEQVDKKLGELLALRGKRGTDKQEQIEQLEILLQFAKTDAQLTSILMHLVSAQFDASPSVATHMPANLWKGALSNLIKIVNVLKSNPALVLTESEEYDTPQEEGQVVVGNLLAYVERLDDEFIKGLQNIDDPHTHEYVQRLQDEQGFLDLTESVQAYYDRLKDPKRAARAAFRRIEHLYYKSDKEAAALAKAAATKSSQPNGQLEQSSQQEGGNEPTATDTAVPADQSVQPEQSTIRPAQSTAQPQPQPQQNGILAPDNIPAEPTTPTSGPSPHSQLIHDLAVLVYAHGDERLRARTMLMHIFHHALHDRFYEARDMMLMSHLQESIHQMDIPTQILFNRTMVQLGLCAFRCNLIWEAHSCLSEICGVSRMKELLAQGVTSTRFQDKNVEQEKLEKKRQVPFHMHINLELLECVHLISAMLLEVPNMAANPFDAKRKVISRTFRRLMDYFDRQVFSGPPENNRDFVAAAAKALAAGNWKTTESLLFSIKVWSLMPSAEVVKTNVRKRIQEEGLRTYLFNYGNVYDSISLAELADMFELEKNHVHSLVSKMMINEELKASWDQPTGAIVMHKVEPSKLQYLALQFAEKAAVFVENNERLLDTKTGNNFYKEQGSKGVQAGQQGQDRRQDRSSWQEESCGGYRRQPYNNQYQQKPYGGSNSRDNKDNQREGKQKDAFTTFQTVRSSRHGEGIHRNK